MNSIFPPKNSRSRFHAIVLLLSFLGSATHAPAQTNFATLSTDGAWCWYSDPRALFHNGKLYYGYVKSSGKTVLDVFDLATGVSSNLWSSSFTQVDDHNVPGLCVKQDGKMLAVYAGHFLNNLYHRTSTSTNPITAADWNPEQILPNSYNFV